MKMYLSKTVTNENTTRFVTALARQRSLAVLGRLARPNELDFKIKVKVCYFKNCFKKGLKIKKNPQGHALISHM